MTPSQLVPVSRASGWALQALHPLAGQSAGGLIEHRLDVRVVNVVRSHDRRVGRDLRGDRLAAHGGDSLLDSLRADVAGELRDEGLHDAGAQLLDLCRSGVEADHLDLTKQTSLLQG